ASVSISINFSPFTYAVKFNETGLPSGTIWYVNLSNGQTFKGSSNVIIAYETNGSYSFTIATVDKRYAPSPYSGSFTVNGSSLNISISFTLVKFVVTFNETGLPPGTLWFINLTNGESYRGNTTSISFTEPNGTYSFTIATVNKFYAPLPYSGSFTVNGAMVFVNITFYLVTYKVIFKELNLPPGTLWYVNMTGGKSYNGTGPEIYFNETNGTYSFTVSTSDKRYRPYPASGTFTVNGSDVTVTIYFKLVTFNVTVNENGLPSGTLWFVNLSNGQSFKGNSTSITFSEPNGSYSFTIATVDKRYAPSPYSGSFTVDGANVSISIAFHLVTFGITFTESGLPSGTLWFVNLSNGQTFSSTLSTITFIEPNGSYTFTIATVNKFYAPSPLSGNLNVNGSNVTVHISFYLVMYRITFIANGLPSGTLWFLNLSNGQQFSLTGSQISFKEPNGSYSFTVSSSDKRYSPSPSSGTFTVNGNDLMITINFVPVTFKVTFTESGLPPGTVWFVNLSNGQSFKGNGSSIQLSLINGSYTFTISTSNKSYAPVPYSGSFTVNGAAVNIAIQFSIVLYKVTFFETGLPSGTKWYLNLSNGLSLSSTGSSILILLPNGTYYYTVSTNNKLYAPATPSGSFRVSGSDISPQIHFYLVTYKITVSISGLPSGTLWFLNISNGLSITSKGSSIIFYVPNGSYTFTIATADKRYRPSIPGGSFVVNGSDLTINVAFEKVTYKVTFIESNLPAGTLWYVNLTNGKSYSTTGNNITLYLTNGTYSYSIGTVNKIYYAGPGTFTVNGKAVQISIIFSPVVYRVTFIGNGLNNGVTWWISVGSQNVSSSQNIIVIYLTNGTYTFNVSHIPGYRANLYSGNFTVYGSDLNITIDWELVLYRITIIQSGITNGTLWSATLTGKTFYGEQVNITFRSTTDRINFFVPNGTYTYRVNLPEGYTSNNLSGNVTVSGTTVTKTLSAQGQTGYSSMIYIAAAIIIVAIILIFLLTRRGKRKRGVREFKEPLKNN
ncbi:MAG: hypothetical protein ACP5G5_05585, partial [Thermoplasmata archaeon]